MARIPACVALACVLALPAASADRPVVLRSGAIGPSVPIEEIAAGLRITDRELEQGGPVVVRFARPVGPLERAAAAAAGLRLAAPVGADAYLGWIAPGKLDTARRAAGVDWIAPYHPGLRIAPEVGAIGAQDPHASVPVTVHLFAHADVGEIARRLEVLGVPVRGVTSGAGAQGSDGERAGRIVITPSAARLVEVRDEIARWPETQWIGLRPAYRLLNDSGAWVGQSGIDAGQTTPISDRGLTGQGQVIGVLDTGIDADMCFFRDPVLGLPPTVVGFGVGAPDPAQRKIRIVDFLWNVESPADPTDWDTQGHGTHVAGTLAGDNFATPGVRDPIDGMAPRAQLVVQDGGYGVDNCADLPAIGCPAADLIPFFEQAYQQGARIHSNSWGDRENLSPLNIYSDGSQDADQIMWTHPDFLLVFAAGNSGSANGTVLSPASAKNVLAVGATNHDFLANSLAFFSSHGPVADGRIKPDVTAPGVNVLSGANDQNIASNNCGSIASSGTSMACPTAAGLGALVREYFEKGFYPSGAADPADALAPSAALVKAMLIASARAMEALATPPPSMEQGWGRVLLDDALYFPADRKRLVVADRPARFSSPADPADVYTVQVTDSTEPLEVVLTWTDYPSTPAASVNLVNDLDLTVEAPGGAILKGNVFSGGASQIGGSADRRNNVEVVKISVPSAGVYTIRVSPFAVPQPAQGYALVTTGRVLVPGVLLERVALTLDDSVGGDGDGVLEPGEWVDLPLTLANGGTATATQVTAGVESLSPYVDVVNGLTQLADLTPGGQGTTTAPQLRIHVHTDLPCTASVLLRFTYAAAQRDRSEDTELPTGSRTLILVDDFEGASSWTHVPAESTAPRGAWIIGDPVGTGFQPEEDATVNPGTRCLYTAENPLNAQGSDDVDAGVVVARSGSYDLSGHPNARLTLSRWFGNRDVGLDPGDFFRLQVRAGPASPDVLLENLGSAVTAARWTPVTFRVADFVTPGPTVQLAVSTADGALLGNVIEAAIDDVTFWEPACDVHDPAPNAVAALLARRSGNDVVLSWMRPPIDPTHGEATGYRIQRSATASGGFAVISTFADPAVSITRADPGAATSPATIYFYLVVAENAAGVSP